MVKKVKKKKVPTYFKIAAGNPTLLVPRDVSNMKWLTLAVVAAHPEPKLFRYCTQHNGLT